MSTPRRKVAALLSASALMVLDTASFPSIIETGGDFSEVLYAESIERRLAELMESVEILFWAVLAALAFVGEILSVPFFLLFFSIGAVVALVIALAGLGVALQATGFIAASLLSMAVLRPALVHRISFRSSERYESQTRDNVAGKSGMVTSAIEPGGSGTVRIGSGEFWTARALYPEQRIESGTRVRVLGTDGLTAVVEAVEKIEEGGE
jgi:membrane protein implicated in regulation of membrane protease activity